MRYRTFGRTGWRVSEIGYGMWGMGGWSGADDAESLASLQHAVELGCNFYDTAWAYGEGRSEALLGQLVRANPHVRLYTATKIPPKNQQWPARATDTVADTFPPDHIERKVHESLEHAGLDSFARSVAADGTTVVVGSTEPPANGAAFVFGPTPRLTITYASPNSATVSWAPTNSPEFFLQTADKLVPTNWVYAPSGTPNPMTISLTNQARFYRLFSP